MFKRLKIAKLIASQRWLKRLISSRDTVPVEIRRAREIVAAVDRGGMPLNPATLNAVARELGLEVHRTARPEETIARIRQALERCRQWS